MSNIKFDIITINFNGSRFIEKTLESVFIQNYSDYQHIIQDGNSSDSSCEIIQRIARVNHNISMVSEPDKGPANALNKAMIRSDAEYVLFLNSDDLLLPDSLHKLNIILQSQPNLDILIAGGLIIDETGERTRNYHPSKFSRFKYAYGVAVPLHPATIFKRNFLESTQISFNEANKSCWDGEFIVDCSFFNPKIGYSESLISAFRVHRESISSNLQNSNYTADQNRIFEKITGRPFRKFDHAIGLMLRILFLTIPRIKQNMRGRP